MIKKWLSIFSKEKQELEIKIEKDESKKGIMGLIQEHEEKKTKIQKEKELTHHLMESLMQFREETKSLDYIRDEIEQVMSKKSGEAKLMEGFAQSFKKRG